MPQRRSSAALLDDCRARLGLDDSLTPWGTLALARVQEARGYLDAAATLYHAALEIARKHPTDRQVLATAVTASGRSRQGAGDRPAAEALFREWAYARC